MIGYYNYTVWLTYVGLVSGVSGLFAAGCGNPLVAVVCLLFSGFCDLFDGRVARTKKDRTDEERRYGIQIDSLSDIICFGVLPCAVAFSMGLTKWYWAPLYCAYVFGALARLAYYNVTEEDRQKATTEVRHYYLGLPVTSAAITFPVVFCFYSLHGDIVRYVYAGILLLTAICFIAPIRVPKPHKTGIFVMLGFGVLIGLYLLIRWFMLM